MKGNCVPKVKTYVDATGCKRYGNRVPQKREREKKGYWKCVNEEGNCVPLSEKRMNVRKESQLSANGSATGCHAHEREKVFF